jgi:hypothetical protein
MARRTSFRVRCAVLAHSAHYTCSIVFHRVAQTIDSALFRVDDSRPSLDAEEAAALAACGSDDEEPDEDGFCMVNEM